jgi:hypothetical protein
MFAATSRLIASTLLIPVVAGLDIQRESDWIAIRYQGGMGWRNAPEIRRFWPGCDALWYRGKQERRGFEAFSPENLGEPYYARLGGGDGEIRTLGTL